MDASLAVLIVAYDHDCARLARLHTRPTQSAAPSIDHRRLVAVEADDSLPAAGTHDLAAPAKLAEVRIDDRVVGSVRLSQGCGSVANRPGPRR
jgi:hypothetical protein